MKYLMVLVALLATGSAMSGTAWGADSQASYVKHCSLCHQPDAQGIPGTFPRIWGRIGQIAATPEGAAFVAQAVLWGMSGTVSVDDVPVTGVMPGVPHVSDEEIAAIVDYLITEGGTVKNTSAFTVETVKAARAAGRISQATTNALRNELFAAGIIK
jgi:mono/diheme cytochrome c family protein